MTDERDRGDGTVEGREREPTTYAVLEVGSANPGTLVEFGRVTARSRREAVSKALDTDAPIDPDRRFKAVPLSSWKTVRPKPPRQVSGGFEEFDDPDDSRA